MPCYHPLPAYRNPNGSVTLWRKTDDLTQAGLRLPCGGCIGCRAANAKAWTLRNFLEQKQHDKSAFTTLTYNDKTVPVTLSRRHLQLFIKRIRKALGPARPIRFFACGEYGEQNQRPHYHALLYGMDDRDRDLIHHEWGNGHTKTETLTPARIAYAAGYSAKKLGWADLAAEERIDYNTGEIYNWVPPFLQMSRRPGIGANARQWTNSWRSYAILNGRRQPVPRYLHEAWKAKATEEEIQALANEKAQIAALRTTSSYHRRAGEQIEIAKQRNRAARRHL